MPEKNKKPKLIIAGPGAGKTFNMVQTIIEALPNLNPSRYLAVITYTNSATNNIRRRLSRRVDIPENLFIGTIHSFLNRFVVIPYATLSDPGIGNEKVFVQCQLKDVFESFKKRKGGNYSLEQSAVIKSKLKEALNKNGYITFDQTLSLAKRSMKNKVIRDAVARRLQFLFVDEFQDTNNHVFSVIEDIRKGKQTLIYCVGDPEQYIQSFDSSVKSFSNIPILKVARSNNYDLELNIDNHRSSKRIVEFINHFNKAVYVSGTFQQESRVDNSEEFVKFLPRFGEAKNLIDSFNQICDNNEIAPEDRCIIAKKNDVIKRVISALNENYTSPKKSGSSSPLKLIKETLLSCLETNQTEFCKTHKCEVHELRKHCVSILYAIIDGRIDNENSFGNYVQNELKFTLRGGIPIKIDNLRIHFNTVEENKVLTVCNIHTIKGQEAEAVLTIAKTEEELLLWLEIDRNVRETDRGNEKTDYPRLGYVAFSRARKLLCIGCLEKISYATMEQLRNLGVDVLADQKDRPVSTSLF